jgi:polyhydroxybutyrate depolymerase
VILNLHGYGSYATEQASYSRLPNEGGDRGFIAVTPAGQGSPQHWNLLPAAGEATDYEFLGALLDSLEATGCVDADREYATCISNGGAMSAFLACAFNDRLAAVATVAFTLKPVGCEAGQTMPMLAFHGTADPLVPYTGGTVLGLSFAGAETGIADWATQDGCSSTPTETAIADDVTRLDFPRCPDGLAVQLYRIEGGGHTWPGSPVNVSRLGATTHSIDASQLMLDFFSQHARSDR